MMVFLKCSIAFSVPRHFQSIEQNLRQKVLGDPNAVAICAVPFLKYARTLFALNICTVLRVTPAKCSLSVEKNAKSLELPETLSVVFCRHYAGAFGQVSLAIRIRRRLCHGVFQKCRALCAQHLHSDELCRLTPVTSADANLTVDGSVTSPFSTITTTTPLEWAFFGVLYASDFNDKVNESAKSGASQVKSFVFCFITVALVTSPSSPLVTDPVSVHRHDRASSAS
ncbi:hypothetical protein niasHT_029562 [Heterodera trifolii]|uniref:Uncharacterized protein n=1 Tax=Heterodera trifolii TaxID=157864 RepID=A0ABD2JB10_9BILA